MSDVFVHARGLVESDAVGDGTRVWAFAHIAAGARIGMDCNVCDGVFVEDGAVVGDRVTIKPGVQLWRGVTLEDDVFIGPNATFTNDPYPRSRQWLDEHPRTLVRRGASIGANATILPGLEIGVGAMVGAGAVVTRSVPPHAIVMGNPARITGYSSATPDRPDVRIDAVDLALDRAPGVTDIGIGGVRVHQFARNSDMRGSLTAGSIEPLDGVPFAVKRWFIVYDVPSREVRGEHAHRVCHQFLICVAGSVMVAVDDGRYRRQVSLDDPTRAVYIPPMVWGTQYRYEADAKLLVFASHLYDPDDYIRDYSEFLAEKSTSPSSTDPPG